MQRHASTLQCRSGKERALLVFDSHIGHAAASVDFAVKSTGAGWVGLAWGGASNPTAMVGSTAVIGRLQPTGPGGFESAGVVDVWDLKGETTAGVLQTTATSPNTFTISNVRLLQFPCIMHMSCMLSFTVSKCTGR